MSADAEALREEAERVLGSKLPAALHDAADDVLIRHVVCDLLDAPADRGPSFYRAAFETLATDPRVAQARRDLRRQQAETLRRAPPAGSC